MAKMTPLLLRLEPEMIALIDAARGDASRALWVRRACERALLFGPVDVETQPVELEGGAAGFKVVVKHEPRIFVSDPPKPIAFAEVGDPGDFSPRVQVGPTKAEPGSRLKKPKGKAP